MFARYIGPLLIILGFATWSLSAVFQSGQLATHDGIWHNRRAVEMYDMLKAGQFPVRWAANLDYQYGTPLFNFVYPLPYYLSSLPMSLGLSANISLKLLVFGFYVLGGLGIYFIFGKSRLVGVISALLYLLNPYQFVNIFVRGAIGEIFVLGLAPWVFLILEQQKRRAIKWYDPLPLALALLSHNFLGLLLLPIILGYGCVFKSFKRITLSLLLSLGLAGFFLIPMYFENVNLLSSMANNYSFVWSDHFVEPLQLIYSQWGYQYSMPGTDQDGMTFQLGYTNIIVILLSLLMLFKACQRRDQKYVASNLFLLICLLGSIILMLPISHPIWEIFSLLRSMQFPWRFLGISTILLGVITGRLLSQYLAKHRLSGLFLIALLLSIALFNTWAYRRPERVLTQSELYVQNTLLYNKTATALRSELIPKWAPIERESPTGPDLIAPRISTLAGSPIIRRVQDDATRLTFIAEASDNDSSLRYFRNYYPSWQGLVDGQNFKLSPTPTGEITIPLMAGTHSYEIAVRSTSVESFANAISILSLIAVIYLFTRPIKS